MAKDPEEIDDRELTTRLLKPPEFKPAVPVADLVDFNQRDQKLLLGFYAIAEKVDWLVACALEGNSQQRELEREIIRTKRWRKRIMTRMALASGIVVFVMTTLTSGLLAQLATVIVDHIFKK